MSPPTWEQYLSEHDLFVVTAADKAVLDAVARVPLEVLQRTIALSNRQFVNRESSEAAAAELARREAAKCSG